MKRSVLRTLCECAVIVAVEVVLNRFVSFKALGLKFGISFFPIALCAVLHGPWWAMGSYIAGDIIGSLIWPMGAYFPGFTLTCALMGLTYGFLLYGREKLSYLRIVLAAVINCGVLGLLLNSLWMSLLYSTKDFAGWMVYRLPQEGGVFLLHLLLLPLLDKVARAIKKAKL